VVGGVDDGRCRTVVGAAVATGVGSTRGAVVGVAVGAGAGGADGEELRVGFTEPAWAAVVAVTWPL
jgi:hypothetical protein